MQADKFEAGVLKDAANHLGSDVPGCNLEHSNWSLHVPFPVLAETITPAHASWHVYPSQSIGLT